MCKLEVCLHRERKGVGGHLELGGDVCKFGSLSVRKY